MFSILATRQRNSDRVASYRAYRAENIEWPRPTGGLEIRGIPVEGSILTAFTGNISGADEAAGFVYRWKRDGTDITGATSKTYTLTGDDVDSVISVNASWTEGGHTVTKESERTDVVESTD